MILVKGVGVKRRGNKRFHVVFTDQTLVVVLRGACVRRTRGEVFVMKCALRQVLCGVFMSKTP